MSDEKRNGIAEKLILFAVFLVFAGIIVAFAYRGNYIEIDNSSKSVTSFQYSTSKKADNVSKVDSKVDSTGPVTSESSSSSASSSVVSVCGKININTATVQELDTLPGIGEKKAQAIIDYRENESVFLRPEDIMNVSGIGQKTYEKLKDLITVE